MSDVEPRKIMAAARAAKLLIDYGIDLPEQIELEDIAWDLGIEITRAPLQGAAAHLVRIGKSGAISLNDSFEEGPARFAVAHELGHWQMHQDISQSFLCTQANMRDYLSSGPELEANIFACELLMPRRMMDKMLWRSDPSLAQPKAISKSFRVSLTAGALRWAEISKRAVIAVFSDGKKVSWWRRNDEKAGQLWCESKQPISVDSAAFTLGEEVGGAELTREVPWEVWFPHVSPRSATVIETSIRLGAFPAVVSLIWVPDLD